MPSHINVLGLATRFSAPWDHFVSFVSVEFAENRHFIPSTIIHVYSRYLLLPTSQITFHNS